MFKKLLFAKWSPWIWPARHWHVLALLFFIGTATHEWLVPDDERSLGDASFDTLVQKRVWASDPDPRILIIDIDERSLADMAGEFGRWPWPRDTLATVLAHAHDKGAKAVVFDILFSDRDTLRPGGDQALAQAVVAHPIGLYPVLRLPANLDAKSQLTAAQLPGLAFGRSMAASAPSAAASSPKVAAVLPFMDSIMKSGRLGTHTAKLDKDGKLRSFAWYEPLAGGAAGGSAGASSGAWHLRSMPAAVVESLMPGQRAGGTAVSSALDDTQTQAQLIVWRKKEHAYPRVPFSVAFACAEGREKQCPNLEGRILILGASASSLHDVQSSPLVRHHAGVDILATLIDNALHQRIWRTPAPWLHWLFSLGSLALAWWLIRKGNTSPKVFLGLPLALMTISYLSLHSEWLYLDLALPAGVGLGLLSFIKTIDTARRMFGGAKAAQTRGPWALVCGTGTGKGEWLEREVFDRSIAQQLPITGHTSATGSFGGTGGLWILWALSSEGQAQDLSRAITQAVPGSWARPIAVPGDDPQAAQHALYAAVAAQLVQPIPPASPPLPGPAKPFQNAGPAKFIPGS